MISPTAVAKTAAFYSAPGHHFAAGPPYSTIFPSSGRAGGAGRCPTVGAGIVSPAGVQIAADITAVQARQLPACLLWPVKSSGSRRAVGGGGCPVVGAGLVSAGGVSPVEAENDLPE